jgi:hypothetical protein
VPSDLLIGLGDDVEADLRHSCDDGGFMKLDRPLVEYDRGIAF